MVVKMIAAYWWSDVMAMDASGSIELAKVITKVVVLLLLLLLLMEVIGFNVLS